MENIRLAFQGIWSHKLRSFLTMLGIIIGIASIITIVSTIKGTNEQIKQNLIGSGSNVVAVQLYEDDYAIEFGYNSVPESVRVINEKTKRAELERLPGVDQVSFYRYRRWSDNVSVAGRSFSGETYGVDSAFFSVNHYTVTYGTDFSQRDFDSFRKVVILDKKAASALFPRQYPVGQTLEIGEEPFIVIGIVEKNDGFEPVINSMQDYQMYADTSSGKIFIPGTTWPVCFQFDEPQMVAVKATSTDDMTTAGKSVADNLTASQIISTASSSPENPEEGEISANTGKYSYRSQDLLQQAQQLQEMSNATSQQLIWIASISLLVGGIGVMNIMLVSVTERTSEIGLKKAMGAKKRRIRMQFLTEAATLTSLGGILGVALGIGLAELISRSNQIPVAISAPAIAIAVVFSMVIGVVFGMLPAIKAANLNPIEALRRD